MRHIRNILLLTTLAFLSSCFKDEPLNSECDIQAASVHLSDPLTLFYNASDTAAQITAGYASSVIEFTGVVLNGDLTSLAPTFTITEGATIEPASGTARDFSQGGLTYTVTSEDGQWSRTYTVSFVTPQSFYEYDFENYYLEDDGKYYIWSDKADGETPNWATPNPGFAIARSKAEWDEYPTIPDTDGYDGACVRLQTVDTGSWGDLTNKRLAAGSIYLGEFDVSKALTETLQSTLFGLPFDSKPLRFTGYYKYSPGAQMQDKAGNKIDGEDEPAVYAVLYRNHDDDGNHVVLTGETIGSSDLRIAKAEVTEFNKQGEWTSFDVAFDYWSELDEDVLASMGYNLVILCSASKDGDSYEGAIGSTLWVDKLAIVTDE